MSLHTRRCSDSRRFPDSPRPPATETLARKPHRPQSARRRLCPPRSQLCDPSTESPAIQPTRTVLQPRVIGGIPVDAIHREIEDVVAFIGGPSKPRARQRHLATTQTAIDVEAAATDEGDCLAKSSRDGGERRHQRENQAS